MPISLRTWAAAAVLVLGFTTQNVTIVFWLESKVTTGLGVLFHSALTFVTIFGGAALAFAFVTGDWSVLRPSNARADCRLLAPFWRERRLTAAQLLFAVGVANALNGFGIVYASNSRRTPPLIQTVLQNGGLLASVPFSKLLLGDRKTYAAREPLAAAALLLGSIAVSVAPSLTRHTGKWHRECGVERPLLTLELLIPASGHPPPDSRGASGLSAAAWVAVYVFGISQGALYNTIQQLYLMRQGLLRPGVSGREEAKGILRALFFSNLAQAVAIDALFWVDALPWFGFSRNLSQVASRTGASLGCSLFGVGTTCRPATPGYAWAFVLSYVAAYVAAAQLNKESSTFNMLCLVVVTASTAVVFELPGVNPNPVGTPLWSVVIALLLSLTGSVLWKRWESRTPAAEQFAAYERGGEADGLWRALLDEIEDDDLGVGTGGGELGAAEKDAALLAPA
jgi:hypothetical protein